MTDRIIRVTAAKGHIRAFFADTRQTANEGFLIHNTSPVVTAALGRLLTAAAMFGAMLKNDGDLVTLTIKGDGPLKSVVATGDASARVKGYPYINDVDLPLKANGKLDVGGAFGEGTLTVIKDIGLKEPYIGTIPLASGEIAEDLTVYFSVSEQTPAAVALGVLIDVDYTVKQSGGFLIQLMPGCDEEIAERLEETLKALPPLTALYDAGQTPEDLMEMVLSQFGIKIHETMPVTYACNCTRGRVEKALISVGRDEIAAMLHEDGQAALHCHFCGKDYRFGDADLKALLAAL